MIKELFKKILDSRVNEGQEYQASLNVLIERTLKRGKFIPNCPVCATKDSPEKIKMVFRRAHISYGIKGVPIRDDVHYKCPVCFHTLHRGFGLKEYEAKEEIRLRGNSPYLSHPSGRKDERENEEIIERLKKLGYGFKE